MLTNADYHANIYLTAQKKRKPRKLGLRESHNQEVLLKRKELTKLYTPTRFRTLALDSKPDYSHHINMSIGSKKKNYIEQYLQDYVKS